MERGGGGGGKGWISRNGAGMVLRSREREYKPTGGSVVRRRGVGTSEKEYTQGWGGASDVYKGWRAE